MKTKKLILRALKAALLAILAPSPRPDRERE